MSEMANAEQRAAWDGEGGHRWVAQADRRDRALAPAADALLAAADLRDGERILDVGCGCGATTLAAARAVGDGGTVVGIDLSGPMLAVARARTADAGGADVELVHGDAQTRALPVEAFTAAISRFGTMFFADPVAAFTNVAAALRPGGRLRLATWQPLVANEWLTTPYAVLHRHGHPPPETDPTAPGPFAQSDPAAVTATLGRAGYEDVDLEPVRLALTFGDDPVAAADYLAATGTVRTTLESMPDDRRARVLEDLRRVLAERATPDGVRLGGAVWIVRATRAMTTTARG